MREKDSSHFILSVIAVGFDALAVYGGFSLATWMRFDSGWFVVNRLPPANYVAVYHTFAAVTAVIFLFVLRNQGLLTRPQTGSFINKIPRLVRAAILGSLFTVVLAFALVNSVDISRLVIGISCFTITFFLLLERYILFRAEWNLARHSREKNQVLVLGTNAVAAHVRRAVRRQPMLRSQVVGFVRTDLAEADPEIETHDILGTIEDVEKLIKRHQIDQVILTGSVLSHDHILSLVMLCEQQLVTFNMVPDLFRIMTASMDVQALDDIPLLGLRRWPLDMFLNRALKRCEDVVGALVGLLLTAPIMVVAAVAIRRDSPGPIFYKQERCGEAGREFTLYKLRTMREDAERDTGPVFTAEQDQRRTRVGGFLRRHNLDELPQLWNVLKGDMTLVGPRPERPHFVEQFKTGIAHYMWRHVSKPGLTGWAQVNGLRGDTSIAERVRYDLYYLENWSLAFDFKILVKTLFARRNAY